MTKREHKKIKKGVINRNVSNKEHSQYFSLFNLFHITLNLSLLELKNKNTGGKCKNLLQKMSKWQLFLTKRPPAHPYLTDYYCSKPNNFGMVAYGTQRSLIEALFLWFITQIFNPIVELAIPIGIPTKETKVEMKTHLVIVEIAISNCSM